MAVGLLASGCASGAVGITPPRPPASIVSRCDTLAGLLPSKLAGLDSRNTRPHSPLTHAWGAPAIRLSCGVSTPPGYRPRSASTLSVDNVEWFERVAGRAVIWTAIRSAPDDAPLYIALTVPRDYPAADAFLTALAGPIKQATAGGP